ncbi:MAG: helix-hairpin-helix domain-containing protein [Mollicutes bacterium]|nr:MAG: helix-hairpin-helix domain-containing protein [Mollicutes bacterium]
MGIRYLGTRTARLISEHYPTPLSLLSASIEDLQRIKGIGERCSTSLYNFFQIKKNITLLQELQSLGVGLVKAIATSTIKETFLTGKKIVITGTFAVSRRVLIEKLQQIGVKVVITITSQTDYVLVGSNPGSKFQKAERLGIKIISENQLKSLI